MACLAVVGLFPGASCISRTAPALPPDAIGPYTWELPPGFPRPWVPEDNPMSAAKVDLGRHLFYDTRLSRDGDYSCASCHRQELAFTDGRALAIGTTGETHSLSSMSLANVAYNAAYGWADPTVRSLEHQAMVPMLNELPVELGVVGHEAEIVNRLRGDPRYVPKFRRAFPDEETPIHLQNVSRAIAAFERVLISGRSPFDRWVYGGDSQAMSAAARRGMLLFYSERLGCAACHQDLLLAGPMRTDETDSVEAEYYDTGLARTSARSAAAPSPGTMGVAFRTGLRKHRSRFRVPTLRNIEVTAPYMHDGSIPDLAGVIKHYADSGRRGRSVSRKIRGFTIDGRERTDLIEFLHSLTDPEFLGDPRFGDPFAPQHSSR